MTVKKICVFPGDGIGPEVVREGLSVLRIIEQAAGKKMFEAEEELLGGASYDVYAVPMAPKALALAKASDAVLLGAVGGPRWIASRSPFVPRGRSWGFARNWGSSRTCAPLSCSPRCSTRPPCAGSWSRGST